MTVTEMDQEQQLQKLQVNQHQQQQASQGQQQPSHGLASKPPTPGYQSQPPPGLSNLVSPNSLPLAQQSIDQSVIKAKQEARLRYQTFQKLSDKTAG